MIVLIRNLMRRRARGYYRQPHRLRRFVYWVLEQGPPARLALRLGLTLLVVAHLVGAALLPGGKNGLFGWSAPAPYRYLTLAPVGDTMGFFKTFGRDGFLVYRIFTEEGKVVEGTFPDTTLTPRLRYDRWAVFSNAASQHRPRVQAAFAAFLVSRLPAPPLKVEMLAARWTGTNGNGAFSTQEPDVRLVLTKLGTYDGLRRAWLPNEKRERK